MFEQPKYIQAGVTLIFPRKSDIRRWARELEDALEGEYNPPTVLGVPDSLQPEVPRILFDSPNGYSQLAISQVTMTISVNFSPDYQIDRHQRISYLARKIPYLFKLLEVCKITNPSFIGLNWLVRIGALNATDDDVIEALCGYLMNPTPEQKLFDLEIKRVETLENKYFVNSSFTNYRQWNDDIQLSGVGRRPHKTAIGRGIQILFDFNDRYSYNEESKYQTGIDTAMDILAKAQEISDTTIRALTRGIE